MACKAIEHARSNRRLRAIVEREGDFGQTLTLDREHAFDDALELGGSDQPALLDALVLDALQHFADRFVIGIGDTIFSRL